MATQTIESFHQAFFDWRKSHGKGPYPTKLKRSAIATLSQTDLAELGRRLGMSAANLKAWRGKAEPLAVSNAAPDAPQERSAFYEVPASLLSQQAVASASADLELELEMQRGYVLRLRGAVTGALLRELVMALRMDEVPA
jgi:hypothetical protein